MTSWNRGAERLFGYARDEIVGRPAELLMPDGFGDELTRLGRVVEHGLAIDSYDTVRKHRDGRPVHVRISIGPVHDEQGKTVGIVATARRVAPRATAGQDREHLEDRIIAAASDLQERLRERERFAGQLLMMRDEERQRVGRELHTSAGQLLVALDLQLARIAALADSSDGGRPQVHQAIAESRDLADTCLREVRALSNLLHPPLLEETGLIAAVRWLADGFAQRTGLDVELMVGTDFPRLARDVEVVLFNVLQECLTNIERHADAPSARVELRCSKQHAVLAVSDSGRGMADRGEASGVGIPSMRERVRRVHGRLVIRSTAHGTVVRATLPLRRR